jgi:hypothetical protein
LTQNQYIDICIELNGGPIKKKETTIFFENPFGKVCLN